MCYLDKYKQKLAYLQDELDRYRSDIQESQAGLGLPEKEINHSPDSLSIEIISVHIPKTAGSLLRGVLQKIYGEDRCFLEYTPVDRENLFQGLEKIRPNHKVIHGHTAWRWISMFPDAKKIVWLRNPIARIVSEYYFITSFSQEEWAQVPGGEFNQRIIEEKLGISEYIEFEFLQNSMYHHCALKSDLNNLVNIYSFVGLQEFFTSDFIDLSNLLGWSNIELWQENKNQHSEYEQGIKMVLDDKRLLSKIISLNQKDMELYRLALELRAERRILPKFILSSQTNSLGILI
ncbi:sulfotransferase family 2 domain-containing protein [Microcoleus sp. T3_B1]|uniref:sulfotransferase family 2 domain-containing protein n=1 Tax=Microcoleus sp. T3_B1 TaxID=3055425 RepID=UPI002FD13BAF